MAEQYVYGKENLPEKYTMPNGISKTYQYGPINRPYKSTISTQTSIQLETLYHISKRNATGQSEYRTMQVYQETLGKQKYIYSYDKLGNIIQIKEIESGAEKVIATYAYDELNQLVRENDLYSGLSKVYTYDQGGNIREETQYPLSFDTLETATKTISYGYTDTNWKDKMTSYDSQPVTYDAIGNPLSYRGYTMEWQNGRQLKSMVGAGLDVAYQYDSSGMRTSKTVNGEKSEYYYVGSQLTYEKRGTDKELYYFYDSNGIISGLRYVKNGTATDYVLVTNWRGDVESIYSTAGTELARYSYDAWGKVTSIRTPSGEDITDSEHIANVNPIRYRGYYQDTETGMYFLQSRYYDPEVHRMISSDSVIAETGNSLGYNTYIYCMNSPIALSDDTGNWPKFIQKAVKSIVRTATNVKNTVVRTAKNIAKSVMKKTFNGKDGTYSTGFSVSGNYIFGYASASIGISMDRKGNVSIQGSYSKGGCGGLNSAQGVSLTRYRTISNAPNVDKLEGISGILGASVSARVSGLPFSLNGGNDHGFFEDGKNVYESHSIQSGIGTRSPLSGEVHLAQSTTFKTIYKFKLYDGEGD